MARDRCAFDLNLVPLLFFAMYSNEYMSRQPSTLDNVFIQCTTLFDSPAPLPSERFWCLLSDEDKERGDKGCRRKHSKQSAQREKAPSLFFPHGHPWHTETRKAILRCDPTNPYPPRAVRWVR